VLGIFPKAFSPGPLPKGQFSHLKLLKFAISQVGTSQSLRLEHDGDQVLWLELTQVVAASEIAHLRSSLLGKCLWENA